MSLTPGKVARQETRPPRKVEKPAVMIPDLKPNLDTM
jgi:hypothetical protein